MVKAALALLAVLAGPGFGAQAATLPQVLDRMDSEATAFRQMTAKLVKQTFTAVLNDTSEENGTIWLRRSGSGVQMRTDIVRPDPRSIGLENATAQIFYPKINTVQIYDLGKNRGLVDQFLLLGFGSPGRELQKSYTVKLGGEETVAGQKAARLELAPKSAKALEQVTKVELWIPEGAGHPVQQKILQPGGDYYLVHFSEVQLNPNLPDTAFRLQLPAGVKKEYPQK